MELDALFLSRLQFGLTIGFHYLFPPLSIGLSWLMVLMEGMYIKTRDKQYETMAHFWTSIFAVVFAVGVATGIVMEFQFGTNWSSYSRFVGDVFGSALAAEGIFAFFLESGFLAVLVFGWDRVSARMHFFSTIMVAIGALFSSIWIVVANSWQQTPAGYHLVEMMKDGEPWIINGEPVLRAEIVDFWAVVFNPSSVPSLLHVWTAAGTLGAFFVLSISSYYILKNRHLPLAKKMFTFALAMGLVMSLGNIVTGDIQAKVVAKHQPAKLAAMEGHFETGEGGTGLYMAGLPDQEEERVRFGLKIPGALSFLVHRDFKTPVTGLDQFPKDEWPPVFFTFQMFHLMVGLGFCFAGLTVLAAFLWWRGTIFKHRWLLWIFVFAVIGPFITNEAGWMAAEVGRQPWIVQGLLKTADAASPSVSGGQVLFSILLFGLIYVFLFIMWVFILDTKIRKGPVYAHAEAPGTTHDFMDVAAELADRSGHSMTGAHDDEEDER
jgi:cytochrome bd ubiquinol oxidase subunit I